MATIFNKADIKLIECPRDAMQGIHDFIPTDLKIKYIQSLQKVGFHTLDCASFVSPKAIPQMKDSAKVVEAISETKGNTKLSVIVANQRGANDAIKYDAIDYLGYPFSISETFQKRNTNRGVEESVDLVKEILDITKSAGKEMVVYISMGFGNPYEEEWSSEMVIDWVGRLELLGVNYFSISDTVGVSDSDKIRAVFSGLFRHYKKSEFGAHFHTRPDDWQEKVETAFENGCARFDGAIKGFGGCPMAKDELVGNMPTERLIEYFGNDQLKLNIEAMSEAEIIANEVFL
ncbi:hydroxymethylglutaryl-CoA lyase [bacterium]|nr:hydroxymethylglutaryl-CoA lyase [bacterium]